MKKSIIITVGTSIFDKKDKSGNAVIIKSRDLCNQSTKSETEGWLKRLTEFIDTHLLEKDENFLTPEEVYVLLCVILFHDCGHSLFNKHSKVEAVNIIPVFTENDYTFIVKIRGEEKHKNDLDKVKGNIVKEYKEAKDVFDGMKIQIKHEVDFKKRI